MGRIFKLVFILGARALKVKDQMQVLHSPPPPPDTHFFLSLSVIKPLSGLKKVTESQALAWLLKLQDYLQNNPRLRRPRGT